LQLRHVGGGQNSSHTAQQQMLGGCKFIKGIYSNIAA